MAVSVLAHLLRIAMFALATQSLCGISVRNILKMLLPSMGLGLVAIALALAMRLVLVAYGVPPLIVLIASVACGGGGFLAVALLTDHPVAAEIYRLWSFARRALGKSKA